MAAPSGIVCPCGARYDDYRAGLTFADAKQMLWSASKDPRDWRCRSRHAVLGFMREFKLGCWNMEHGACADTSAPSDPT
jgi:hypothetical protein